MPNPVTQVALGATSPSVPERIQHTSPAREVPAKKTVTAPSEVRAALSRAIESQTGERPTDDMLDVLTAHVSHETARGTAMLNYNFGGIKGKSPAGETARYMTHEVLNGERKAMSQGFRAYATLDDGASDYVAVMQARFPEALDQAKGGDPAGFAAALKKRGYYTASEESYTSAIKRLTSDASAVGRAPGTPFVHNVHPNFGAADFSSISRERVGLAPHGARPSTSRVADYGGAGDLLSTVTLSRVMDAIAVASPRIEKSDDDANKDA